MPGEDQMLFDLKAQYIWRHVGHKIKQFKCYFIHIIRRKEEKIKLQTCSVAVMLEVHESWIRLDKQISLYWWRNWCSRREKKKPKTKHHQHHQTNSISFYTEFLNDISNLFKLFECSWGRCLKPKVSNSFIYWPVISNEVSIETLWIISRSVLRQCNI